MSGPARIADSDLYRHLWGTDEVRDLFSERARIRDWVWILGQLAAAQADLGIVPAAAAAAIADPHLAGRLDLDVVAAATRATGHSTLGLIRGLQAALSPDAAEWVYYGATVQDLTDTWTATVLRRVGAIVWRDLRAIEGTLLDLAVAYRDTPMPGRTHGQPGSPVTFGWKAAGFADEIRRHLDRLREGRPRWLVGQLGGAVGTLAFFGDRALALRRRFCDRVGLGDPGMSWLVSRDRVAEFAGVLTLVSGTLGRLGAEVVQLQRPEIGEVAEPASAGGVGSITMPHKRNPELSEHLVTLARLVRANAAVLAEGLVSEHERDGRTWKAEWVALPEVCMLTAVALELAQRVAEGLEVHPDAMRRNVDAARGMLGSEHLLAALAPVLGKHRAQALLQEALAAGRERGASFADALAASDELRPYLGVGGPAVDTGAAAAMVDEVAARARAARDAEPAAWS